MSLLYLLESIRHPILDAVMLALTEFGNEMLFIVAGMLMFWCIDKRQGYYILLCGFFGVYINQFLKITCRIPRPWVLDPDFTIVEAARAAATGYSFPSGHTQTAVGCYAAIALCRREKWVRIACVALAILVPLTRMYLGVHTPLDVGVSILAALLLVFSLYPLFSRFGTEQRLMYPLMGLLTLMAVGFLLYMSLFPFPADIDAENYAHAFENAYKFLGCALGLWIIYEVDRRFIRFETATATVWGQILKLVCGFLPLLLLLEGSKPLFEALLGNAPLRHTLRYCLTVVFAGCVWPLTFPFFARIGAKKKTDRA
ncbi:MAG: phosphatase PAP2 family protein [Clostridia bacterium]|nr:phosphatase PAP2 family protein [Clostridia bacterium]